MSEFHGNNRLENFVEGLEPCNSVICAADAYFYVTSDTASEGEITYEFDKDDCEKLLGSKAVVESLAHNIKASDNSDYVTVEIHGVALSPEVQDALSTLFDEVTEA